NWRVQPTSLAVRLTAPGADAPAAPALTLAADTQFVRQRAFERTEHVMRKAIASVTLVAMLAGCSHVHPSDPTSSADVVNEVNRVVKSRTVDITLLDTKELWAENVRVTADSTWFDVVGRPSHSRPWQLDIGRGVPTSEIGAISIRRHGRGALEGAAVGFLIGAVPGMIVGTRDPYATPVIGGVVFGVIGLAVGFVWGAIAGSKDVYDFTKAPREP
ncbi:hypothetical protein KAT82_02535, partial [bacterium]|nr:hypothetical protein [bacterium]